MTTNKKDQQMIKWEKIRTIGKWKYIFLYGLVISSTTFYLIRLLLDFIFYGTTNGAVNYIIQAVLFGLTIGIVNWFYMERKYKNYIDNDKSV